jgi:hypothetical protein
MQRKVGESLAARREGGRKEKRVRNTEKREEFSSRHFT